MLQRPFSNPCCAGWNLRYVFSRKREEKANKATLCYAMSFHVKYVLSVIAVGQTPLVSSLLVPRILTGQTLRLTRNPSLLCSSERPRLSTMQ